MVTKDALAKQRSAFSATKRALLEKRLRGDSAPVVIPKRPDAEFAPTTFSQQRLWFLDQLEPGTATYNIPIAMRVHGPFQSAILEQCLNELVRRHETWRTTFESYDGIPVQRIAQPAPIALSVQDLSDLPESEREHEAIRLATEYAQMPFCLNTGPLVRVLLVTLHAMEHILVLVQHHSISDGWSIGIVLQEIAVLYEAFQAQKPSPLPELSVQYADYAYWQQQKLQGKELERQLDYWKQQLEDTPAHLDLPTRGVRQDGHSSRGETLYFHLSRALSEQLRTLCQQEGVTLFMTILAAFQTLLYRYTGQDDLMISTSTANRPLPELEPIVGFFVNTLVLRTSLIGDPSFQQLLKRVQEVSLAAFAHQEVPFERAVTRVPTLQVHFILQNTPSQTKELSDVTAERIELENNTAKFDLFLNVEDASEISGFFEYNADLFDAGTIERLSLHFQRLLEAVVQDPEMRLSTFPLLTEEERQQILFAWNKTACHNQDAGCLHELFEAQVARTPLQTALECEGLSLTYQELNQRANQVAHYLRSLGVTAEVPVGLCMERSIEQLVGVLGILKAGGAYLPLDPSYPKERLEWILTDAQVPLLLTQSTLLERLPAHDSTVVCLDASQELLAEMATINPQPLTTDANIAYIIYTSGSTGQPKGVQVTHRSVVNHSQAIARQYHIESSDRVLQFASLSFDAAGEELYPTWLSGATLVLRPAQLPASIKALHSFIAQERLTILNLPTAYWHQWVTHLATNTPVPTSLRLVIVGGEPVQPAHYQRWLEIVGTQIQWSNTYGPTETTITAILYAPTDLTDPSLDKAPIGHPIANMQAYVLDQHLQPVPVGAIGEIYLGGEGLARGYLNRPDLTADRFIPNPYGLDGTRLYRTGDLARYLADGNLLYVGRSDQQVKIRGYRIELGEIENALLQHPAIAESVVLAKEDPSGDKYLAAYIVSNQSALTSGEVRQFLSGHLPEYMLPASYMFLEQFPVTSNGKINRRALPAPVRDRHDSAQTYMPPRTPLEEVLARVWSDVLHIEQIGTHDNFFEIGGHSLRATQLVARIQDIFPVDLPLKHIFEYPTIASLAEALLQDESQREMTLATAELFLMVTDLSDENVEALLNE